MARNPDEFSDSQRAVNEAYKRAAKANRAHYVYSAATQDYMHPFTVTDRQPSRFRLHWRVTQGGDLFEHHPANGTDEIKYVKM